MRAISSISAAALALGLIAVPASAQVAGMPVNLAPRGTGVTVHGEYGRGLNDQSGKTNSVGGGVVLGLPTFQVGAGASFFDFGDNGAEEISFGAHAGYALPLPPATPVSLSIVAGVGVTSFDVSATESATTIFVPAGVTVGFDIPSPTLSVTPWVSPQFRYTRTGETSVSPSFSNSDFGVSGGLNITLPVGLGFSGLLDYDNASEAFLVGGGLYYAIQVPSLAPGM